MDTKHSISRKDPEELFNLRHAQLRNVVERIFGILKRRFPFSVASPEYDLGTQAKFIPAIAALHNFIRAYEHLTDNDITPPIAPLPEAMIYGAIQPQHGAISDAERERAANRRNYIANLMWEDYMRAYE